MRLKNMLISRVDDTVDEVFYLDWITARKYNERRDKDQPMIFTGWYWARGAIEGGPFKTMSAAYRDAWYRQVQHVTPPNIRAQRRIQKTPRVRYYPVSPVMHEKD